MDQLFECFQNLNGDSTAAKNFLELILNLAPNPIIITDRCSYQILFVNAAGERLFGTSFKNRVLLDDFHEELRPLSVEGKPLDEFIHPAAQVRRNGFLDSLEMTWMTALGVRTLVLSSACTLTASNGKFLCVYSVSDITEIKNAEIALKESLETQEHIIAELKEKTAELDRLVAAKQRLLSQLSHEVKNPLGVITGFSSLIKESEEYGSMKPETKTGVEAIARNAEHILMVVNDQLALSKAEFVQPPIQIESINLDEAIQRLGISFGMLASKKGLKLIVENRLKGAIVRTDLKLLRQVVLNLVGNAIKFTDNGEIRVSVFKSEDSRLCFEVQDTGAGIAPENQSRLFEPFYQAHTDVQIRSLGSGLGLNIVKGIANQLGGTIRLVNSQVNVGSTFQFDIPLELI